jgi:MinD-like ATPase involved in chromosome partitioning or flagellar assembly
VSVENLSHLLALDPDLIDEHEIEARLLSLSFGPRILFGPQCADEYTELTAEHTSTITEGLARLADFVMIDLPCYPCPGIRAAVEHSDFVCLVIEKEPSALTAAKVMVDLLVTWGLGMDRVGAVFVSRAAYTASSSLREMGSELKCGIVGAVPQATEACIDALRSGLPMVIQEPENIAATNLTELATRLSADRIIPMSF